MASLLRELLRGCDKIFRYGGEEFAALLPETSFPETLNVAERIRIFIETESMHFLEHIARNQGITVSVGVAAFPQDGETMPELLQVVDELMYKAKRQGKNQVYYRDRVESSRSGGS
jgi:diguanylate cyclase (GGDEF)-like protein